MSWTQEGREKIQKSLNKAHDEEIAAALAFLDDADDAASYHPGAAAQVREIVDSIMSKYGMNREEVFALLGDYRRRR